MRTNALSLKQKEDAGTESVAINPDSFSFTDNFETTFSCTNLIFFLRQVFLYNPDWRRTSYATNTALKAVSLLCPPPKF